MADPRPPPSSATAVAVRVPLGFFAGAFEARAAAASASGAPDACRAPREFLAIFVLSEPCQVNRPFRGYYATKARAVRRPYMIRWYADNVLGQAQATLSKTEARSAPAGRSVFCCGE